MMLAALLMTYFLHNNLKDPVQLPKTVVLQESLSELGYLPFNVDKGRFFWRYDNMPEPLKMLWVPGHYGVMTEGALMSYESDHGLAIAPTLNGVTWESIQHSLATDRVADKPYTYAYVSEQLPESITIWQNGAVVEQSLANTGIDTTQDTTPLGTWPIYLRYTAQTMQGPGYYDPGVPWVNYFHGGDAVHGFWRQSYGFPQSLGCVELPISAAKEAYGFLGYGTLVTVGAANLPSPVVVKELTENY